VTPSFLMTSRLRHSLCIDVIILGKMLRMVRAKNYETAPTFVKVIQRKLLPLFFPDTVYKVDADIRGGSI